MTTHSKQRAFNMRSLRRRQLLKKKLKVNGKDDISVTSASSTTIAGSLASALSLGLLTVTPRKVDLRTELKDQGIQGVDTKLLRELGEDNIDEAVIGEEIAQLSEEYDLHAVGWRQRMVHFLHTMPVEVFMMSLVVLDVLIILSMVVLDMYILEEQLELVNKKGTEILQHFNQTWPAVSPEILHQTTIDRAYSVMVEHITSHPNYTISDEEVNNYNLLVDTDTEVHGADDSHSVHKRAAVKPDSAKFIAQHSYDAAKMIYDSTKANHILHYCSIAILAVFVIEVGLKIIGYGKSYFKNKWELIDGIVILISFSLDVAVTDANFTHEVGKTVLVVFLIWRVIRILNAMVLTSRARTMFRLRVLRKSKRLAEDRNKELSSDLADAQEEAKRLRDLARNYGADNHELVSAQVLSKTSVSATKAGLKNMMAQLLHINTKIATELSPAKPRPQSLSVNGVSCNSLNKLNPNGYNRSRRPSMIGDQTMCHETRLASEAAQDEQSQMRPRAASDVGGMTRLTRKLRDRTNKRRSSAAGINEASSVSDVRFSVSSAAEDSNSVGSETQTPFYAVINESTEDTRYSLRSETKPTADIAKSAQKDAANSITRNDSGVIDVGKQGEDVNGEANEMSKTAIQLDEERGHTNPAFSEDDVESGGSRQSSKSDDSGITDLSCGKGEDLEHSETSAEDSKKASSPPITRQGYNCPRVESDSPINPFTFPQSSNANKKSSDEVMEPISEKPSTESKNDRVKEEGKSTKMANDLINGSNNNASQTKNTSIPGKGQLIKNFKAKQKAHNSQSSPEFRKISEYSPSAVNSPSNTGSQFFVPKISVTNEDDKTVHIVVP